MANPFNTTTGQLTGNGAAKTVTLGYRPCEVELLDETNVILWKVNDSMSSTKAIKITTVAVMTITTNSDLAITDTGFTISATAYANAATLSYKAIRGES